MNAKRVKRLAIVPECLVLLLQQDGTRRLRYEGMPADAVILAGGQELLGTGIVLTFLVASETFPEVKPGQPIPYFDLRTVEVRE